MAKIRFALRGSATVLMGKNTLIRKIISVYLKDNPGHPLEQVCALFFSPFGSFFTLWHAFRCYIYVFRSFLLGLYDRAMNPSPSVTSE